MGETAVNFQLFIIAASGGNLLFNIIQFFALQKFKKDTATNEAIGAVVKDVTALGNRLTQLETQVAQMPTHKDLSDIHEKVNEISDCVSRLEGEFSGAKHTLDLIHEFLMKGGK